MNHYKQFGDLGRTSKSRKRVNRKPKAQQQEEEKPKKEATKKRTYNYVDNIATQVKYLQRFKALANKQRLPTAQLFAFIKSLQRAIHQRKIRKADSYANDIDQMQRIAINAYQRSGGKYTEIKVPGAFMERINEVAKSEKLRPSVDLLKRFVGLVGKGYLSASAKMKKLLEEVNALFEKKKITTADPYYSKVKDVQRQLEKAISQRSPISVSPALLSGLNGIVANDEETESADLHGLDFCEGDEHTAKTQNKVVVKTAQEIAKTHYHILPFDGYYQRLMKNPPGDFWMVFYGLPFQGKTTFAVGFAKYLAENFGNVLYVTSEQWDSEGLRQVINRVEASDLTFALSFSPSLEKAPPLKMFDFIFIDSANAAQMKYEEMLYLRESNPDKAFVTILQSTKGGDLRGDQRWRHSPGIVVKIHEQRALVEKNQYFSGAQVEMPLPQITSVEEPTLELAGLGGKPVRSRSGHFVNSKKGAHSKGKAKQKGEKKKHDWTEPPFLNKSDHRDLKEIKRLWQEGKKREAMKYANRLDTIVRDEIHPKVWLEIGGELTESGMEKLRRSTLEGRSKDDPPRMFALAYHSTILDVAKQIGESPESMQRLMKNNMKLILRKVNVLIEKKIKSAGARLQVFDLDYADDWSKDYLKGFIFFTFHVRGRKSEVDKVADEVGGKIFDFGFALDEE